MFYRNADQAVGEYGTDPPQHHDHSNCLHSKPERRGNEDAVEENYHGGLGHKKCGTLERARCVPKLWMSRSAQLARTSSRER